MMEQRMFVLRFVALIAFAIVAPARACTDILVTPGASVDGSAMIAYNADSPTLYGSIYHYPPTKNNGSDVKRKVFDWDSGVYLGEIAEVNHTFNVVGNSNEHGLVIGETTFGGVAELAWKQTDGIIDYGSLIYITLQRAKTCREAIQIMSELMDTYGYYSGGESFSLADYSGEVWMMEVIGTGTTYKRKGAVWVAQRIPDGYVAAHANQARIQTFSRDDPDNFLYADDVVAVAIHYGLFPADADPSTFSFSDIYCPVTSVNARQGEARVWSIFSSIVDPEQKFQSQYESYAFGKDTRNRMPLYVKPYEKVSVMDVQHLLSSHYEGTVMDSRKDVGSGVFQSPYRPRPLVWSWNDTTYLNERSIATPKTGWSFIAQIRLWLPPPLSGLLWFACDDSSTAPRVPVYSSSTRIAKAYAGKGSQDGVVPPIMEFDMDRAFWVQNMVSNFAYFRWHDIYPVLWKKIQSVQREFQSLVANADQRALTLFKTEGREKAVEHMTVFGVNAGKKLQKTWLQLYGELFTRYRDFYTIVPKHNEPSCGCSAIEPGMSDDVKSRIVKETGDHYRVSSEEARHPEVLSGESKPSIQLAEL